MIKHISYSISVVKNRINTSLVVIRFAENPFRKRNSSILARVFH